jgi:hypothetical protein
VIAAPPRRASGPPPRAQLDFILPDLRHLDEHPADLVALGTFSDEHPFEGLAGAVDWRLCSALSHWRRGGLSTGAAGERVLYPSQHRLTTPRLMLVGLGPRPVFSPERALEIARATAAAAVTLGAARIITTLFGLDHLATPLERTAAPLVHALLETPGLSRVTLAVPAPIAHVTREALTFHARTRGY